MVNRFTKKMILVLALMVAASSSIAAEWCGENGLIRLSFAEGKELQAIKNTDAESGVTMVDLYAYLTDVDSVKKDGEVFLGIGALEFSLVVEGAEAFIVSQEFPMMNFSVGRRPGEIVVGFDPGIVLEKDHTQLVHWQIMFQGNPENIVFRLDSEAGVSCATTPGCPEAAPFGLYTGTESSHQVGSFFGVGYVPAYLNWKNDPDLTPQHGKQTWQQVGDYEKR